MKKLVRIALAFFVLTAFFMTCSTMQAQSLTTSVTKSAVHRFDVKTSTRLMKDLNVEFDLKWPVSGNQTFLMTTFANPIDGVYAVKRFNPKGITAFARGKEIIEWFESKGDKVKIKGKIDFDRPYIFRKEKNGYIVSQKKTEYVDRLFLVLNDMLVKKVVPNLNNELGGEASFSKLEIGAALTDKRLNKKPWK